MGSVTPSENGETRKLLAITVATAIAAAVGAELGKWGIELARKALQIKPPEEPK